MIRFFISAYAFCVGVIGAFAYLQPWFSWFGLNAVAWFSGFLAVVLAVVYLIGSMMNAWGGGGRATTGSGGGRRSKGAREKR